MRKRKPWLAHYEGSTKIWTKTTTSGHTMRLVLDTPGDRTTPSTWHIEVDGWRRDGKPVLGKDRAKAIAYAIMEGRRAKSEAEGRAGGKNRQFSKGLS